MSESEKIRLFFDERSLESAARLREQGRLNPEIAKLRNSAISRVTVPILTPTGFAALTLGMRQLLTLSAKERSMSDDAQKLVMAAGELKDAVTDAKAKLLLKQEAALKVGYAMRRAQNAYWRAKTNKKEMLIDAKRLESAFDLRCAELIREGVELNKRREGHAENESGTGRAKLPTED
jgi:hypothetical protein